MATSRENYQLRAQDLSSLLNELNFIFSRIADRLDKIEGIRGTSTIVDGLTIETNSQIVHGFNTDNET